MRIMSLEAIAPGFAVEATFLTEEGFISIREFQKMKVIGDEIVSSGSYKYYSHSTIYRELTMLWIELIAGRKGE